MARTGIFHNLTFLLGDPANSHGAFKFDLMHLNLRTNIFTARITIRKDDPKTPYLVNHYTTHHSKTLSSFILKVMTDEVAFAEEKTTHATVYSRSNGANHVPPICPQLLHSKWYGVGGSNHPFLKKLLDHATQSERLKSVRPFADKAYGVLFMEFTGDTLHYTITRDVNERFKQRIQEELVPLLPVLTDTDQADLEAKRILVRDQYTGELVVNIERLDFSRKQNKLETVLGSRVNTRQAGELALLLREMCDYWKNDVVSKYLKYARRLLVRLGQIGFLHGDYHLYNFTIHHGLIYIIDFGLAVRIKEEDFTGHCGPFLAGGEPNPAPCVEFLTGAHRAEMLTSKYRTDPGKKTNTHFYAFQTRRIESEYWTTGTYAWIQLVYDAELPPATGHAQTMLKAFLLHHVTATVKSEIIAKPNRTKFEKQLYSLFKYNGTVPLTEMWTAFFNLREVSGLVVPVQGRPLKDVYQQVLEAGLAALVRKVKENQRFDPVLWPLLPMYKFYFEGPKWAVMLCHFERPLKDVHEQMRAFVGNIFEKGRVFVKTFHLEKKKPEGEFDKAIFNLVTEYENDFWLNMSRYQWVYTNRCALDNYTENQPQFNLKPSSIATEEEYAAYVMRTLQPFSRARPPEAKTILQETGIDPLQPKYMYQKTGKQLCRILL